MLNLVKRVGRIRVHAENNIGPARADLLQHIQIPSRLYFDFDPAISSGQLGVDLLQTLFGRVLNADRNTAGDVGPRSSEQLPERLLLLPRLRVPYRLAEGGPGQAAATDSVKTGRPMAA